MRSQQDIKEQIAEVEAVLSTFVEVPTEEQPFSLRLTYQKNRARLEELRAELAEAQSGRLRWKFENAAVAGHAVEAAFLADVLARFDRSARTVGADIARLEDPHLGAPVEEVVAPMVVGTFAGSFGVILEPKARGEQLQMLAPPLFERMLGRVLDLLTTEAGPEEDLAEVLVEKLDGVRRNAVVAVRELSKVLAEHGGSSVLAWEPNTPTGRSRLTKVTARQAGQVSEALARVEPHEPEVREIRGLLVGSDIHDRTFHLIEADTEEQYRGRVEPSINEAVNAAHGSGIRAQIEVSEVVVMSTQSRKATYVLIDFERL